MGTCCPVNLEVNPAKAINKGLSICALAKSVAVFGKTCKTCSTRRYVCQIACVDHSLCTSLTADSWSPLAVSSNTANALHSAASIFTDRPQITQVGQQICLQRGSEDRDNRSHMWSRHFRQVFVAGICCAAKYAGNAKCRNDESKKLNKKKGKVEGRIRMQPVSIDKTVSSSVLSLLSRHPTIGRRSDLV